jgi:hypothetical protein
VQIELDLYGWKTERTAQKTLKKPQAKHPAKTDNFVTKSPKSLKSLKFSFLHGNSKPIVSLGVRVGVWVEVGVVSAIQQNMRNIVFRKMKIMLKQRIYKTRAGKSGEM